MSVSTSPNFDLIIVGGGMVGASLAVALEGSGLRTAIVEAFDIDDEDQPSYDERTVALTWSARQIFSGMGVWEDMEAEGVEPIRDIHISNRGHFGATHLSCNDVATSALGYVVPTRVIGRVLTNRLDASRNVTMIRPAEATHIETSDRAARIDVNVNGQPQQLSASLVVLADGGRSDLGARFEVDQFAYPQHALLSIVSVDRDHNGRAYERFTDEGPIALLPHRNRRYALVWTGEHEAVTARMALSDHAFTQALQESFGDRAGNFSNPSQRKTYPLVRRHIAHPADNRLIVVGNAAHTLHPVAGQGFNLGLRDIAWLAEMLIDAAKSESGDIGAPSVLEHYIASRQREAKRVNQFTHGLITTFTSEFGGTQLARNLGLGLIEHLPFAKRMLLRRTMGISGRVSILASGRPISRHG